MHTLPESTLIYRLKQGDRQAFERLYAMYAKRLFGFCYDYTHSTADAEEVVQDSFVKLWQHKESIQDKETIYHYLFQIAKHQMINRFRRTVNQPSYEAYVDYLDDARMAGQDSASDQVQYQDFQSQLALLEEELSETQRQVFELSVIQGYSHKEISERLDRSEQTVRNQLSQALKFLREKLKDQYLLFVIWLIIDSLQ